MSPIQTQTLLTKRADIESSEYEYTVFYREEWGKADVDHPEHELERSYATHTFDVLDRSENLA